MHDKHGLLSTPISALLSKMTIPVVLGMATVLLFNLVDVFFIAQLGTAPLAAIGYSFPLTFALNGLTMGIGVGVSTLVAHHLGQHNLPMARRLASHSLLLTALLITLLAWAMLSQVRPLFMLLGAEPNTLVFIEHYLEVWLLGMPLLALSMVSCNVLKAHGDTQTPAKLMMLSGAINALLDPLFIFGYGVFPAFHIQGAALASLCSWLISCLILMQLFKKESLLSSVQWQYWVLDCKKLFTLAIPATLSTAMLPISSALVMWLLASQGSVAIAAYGTAQRIESLLLLIVISLASALSPVMAQNLGAQQVTRSFKALFTSVHFALGFQLLVFIMMVPLSLPLAALFAQEQAVQDLLWHYLLIVPLSYGLQGVVILVSAAFNALQRPFYAFLCNVVRLFGLILPCAWLGIYWQGTQGLFYALTLANSLAGLFAYILAYYLKRYYCSASS